MVLLFLAFGIVFLILGTFIPMQVRVRTVVGGSVQTTAEVRWLFIRRRLVVNVGARAQTTLKELLSRAVERRPGMDAVDTSRIQLWRRWWQWRYRGAADAWRYLAPRVRVQQMRILAEVGTGDAMTTALACGGLWALFSQVLGAGGAMLRLPAGAVQVAVQPQFGEPALRGVADCRVGVRPLDLARAGWRLFRAFRRKPAGLRGENRKRRRR